MLLHLDRTAQASEPPSTCFIVIPQVEGDRAFMAELVDLANANRAPTPDLKRAGMTGRVMVSSLAQELGVASPDSPREERAAAVLGELQRNFDISHDRALRQGFHVRIFHW
jgi:hypothetical protein